MITSANFATEHEIEFIRSLGTNHESKIQKYKLLRNYITASRRRVDWGAINNLKAIGFAIDELVRERLAA